MENFGNLPDQIPPLLNNNVTSLYRADVMLCVDWLISITYCFFRRLDWLRQTVLFFLNRTVCVFLTEIPNRNYPN